MTQPTVAQNQLESLLEYARTRTDSNVAALYRASANGSYVPMFWTPFVPNKNLPTVSSASDLAAFLRVNDSSAFQIGCDTFKDIPVQSGLQSFGANFLLAAPFQVDKAARYYLTFGSTDSYSEDKMSFAQQAAKKAGEVLTRTLREIDVNNIVLPSLNPSAHKGSLAPEEVSTDRLTRCRDMFEQITKTRSFDPLMAFLHETFASNTVGELGIIVEDETGRTPAKTPKSFDHALSQDWLLAISHLPYLDLIERTNQSVYVPADNRNEHLSRLIIPLSGKHRTIGFITILGANDTEIIRFNEELFWGKMACLYLLRCREASRSAVLGEVLNTVENERARVSYQLHDETSQGLVALKIRISTAKRAFENNLLEESFGIMEDCERIADQLLSDVNRLSAELRPSELNYLGLRRAIEAEAEKRLTRAGIAFSISGNAFDAHFNTLQETMLLSGIVEALSNCAKHSNATVANISMENDGSWLTVAIQDNGRGFDTKKISPKRNNSGHGFKTMRDCAAAIGGDVWIGSAPAEGTVVRFSVPNRMLEGRQHG